MGFNKNVKKFIVDPALKTSIKDLSNFDPEIVFISVPTPMGIEGNQDSSIVESVITELDEYCKDSIKVVKSTVLPEVLERLEKIDPKIIYNPEFLREKHANTDFINSEIIIFGGNKEISLKVSKAYLNHSRCKTKEHIFTDLTTASLIKYTINTFLATKVIFFNELHSVYEKMGVSDSWEQVIDIIAKDNRIGPSHMGVPGHDGKKGFGGACFPKDSTAFVKYSKLLDRELKILKTAIQQNNKIRSKYQDLDSRETEQNITFSDNI